MKFSRDKFRPSGDERILEGKILTSWEFEVLQILESNYDAQVYDIHSGPCSGMDVYS